MKIESREFIMGKIEQLKTKVTTEKSILDPDWQFYHYVILSFEKPCEFTRLRIKNPENPDIQHAARAHDVILNDLPLQHVVYQARTLGIHEGGNQSAFAGK